MNEQNYFPGFEKKLPILNTKEKFMPLSFFDYILYNGKFFCVTTFPNFSFFWYFRF